MRLVIHMPVPRMSNSVSTALAVWNDEWGTLFACFPVWILLLAPLSSHCCWSVSTYSQQSCPISACWSASRGGVTSYILHLPPSVVTFCRIGIRDLGCWYLPSVSGLPWILKGRSVRIEIGCLDLSPYAKLLFALKLFASLKSSSDSKLEHWVECVLP